MSSGQDFPFMKALLPVCPAKFFFFFDFFSRATFGNFFATFLFALGASFFSKFKEGSLLGSLVDGQVMRAAALFPFRVFFPRCFSFPGSSPLKPLIFFGDRWRKS